MGCRVPRNAMVTIKTAIQYGRAIGVIVLVHFDHGKPNPPKKRPTAAEIRAQQAMEKAEDRVRTKIATCVESNVRTAVWPPSARRGSFTTEF